MAAVTIGNFPSMSRVVPVPLPSAVCFASGAAATRAPCLWCHQERPVSPAVPSAGRPPGCVAAPGFSLALELVKRCFRRLLQTP